MARFKALFVMMGALACSGCVTTGCFAGRDAAHVQARAEAEFPVGSPMGAARRTLEKDGYECREYKALSGNLAGKVFTAPGIACSGPHVLHGGQIALGGLWVITIYASNGTVAGVRVNPFGTPYS